MQCVVYKSLKQFDYYLYVQRDEVFSRVPQGLMQMLGTLEKVMDVELHSKRSLARADVEEVIRQITRQGYYLQMPPRSPRDQPVA